MAADKNSESGSGIADEAGIDGYQSLSEQGSRMWEESHLVTQSGDPYQLMLKEQALQKSEYSGLSGLLRQGVHEMYRQFFSRENPEGGTAQYEDAIQSKISEDKREAYNAAGTVNRNELLGLTRSLGEAAALARTPNEMERGQLESEFQHDDTLANLESLSNKPFSAFQEKAKESQLRAQGRTDDARTAALDFSTLQRVKSLQEQADAETDPTRKAQLQREIPAASDARKIERDSLQQELHRTQMSNFQASPMSAASQMGASGSQSMHDGGGSNLNDAVRKLDDATTKLNKVLAHSKTLVLVKD